MFSAGHCVFKKGVQIEADRVIIIAGVNNHKDINQPGRQILGVSNYISKQNNYQDWCENIISSPIFLRSTLTRNVNIILGVILGVHKQS